MIFDDSNSVQRVFVGTGLNLAISITADGFDMDVNDFFVNVSCGNKVIALTKNDLKKNEDNVYIATIDTSLLGSGMMSVTTIAHIPDENWQKGYRTEINKQDVLYLTGT